MAYTERLLKHGNFLTRLAHGGRYRRTLELASDVRAGVAIDFGCGDAMILRRAQEAGIARSGYGVDSDPAMRESAAATFAGIDGFRFVSPEELAGVVRLAAATWPSAPRRWSTFPTPARFSTRSSVVVAPAPA